MISEDALVDMLHTATGEVLSTMLNLDARPEAAHTEHQPGQADGIVSFVGLAGENCAGTGSLYCGAEAACQLASRFLMTDFVSVDDEVLDALGELTNMIIGNLKNAIEIHLGSMALSIPTVIYGRNFSSRSPGHDEWTVVPFRWDEHVLNVRVCLTARKGGGQTAAHPGSRQEFVLQH